MDPFIHHCSYLDSDSGLWTIVIQNLILAAIYTSVSWNIFQSIRKSDVKVSGGGYGAVLWGFFAVFLSCGAGTHVARVIPLFRETYLTNARWLENAADSIAIAVGLPVAFLLWWYRPTITDWLSTVTIARRLRKDAP